MFEKYFVRDVDCKGKVISFFSTADDETNEKEIVHNTFKDAEKSKKRLQKLVLYKLRVNKTKQLKHLDG